jgi:hypothetical protein
MHQRTITQLVAVVGMLMLTAVPTWGSPIVINQPSGGGPVDASFIDFSYVALVNQTATAGTGTFNEQGGGFFGSYRGPSLADVISGTGLNTTYKLYAVYTGEGTVAPTLGFPGGTTATFNNFNLRLFLDPGMNTTITASPTGTPGGTVSVGGTTSDDVLVGQSTSLIAGQSHAFPGLANGDFNVQVNFSPVGGFLSGPLAIQFADFNGVNTSLQGFSMGNFTSGRVDGSGNVSFSPIPEPTTLLLIGSGLAALGWIRRKQMR